VIHDALSDLTVIYRPTGTLTPHPNNDRTHKQHQIRQIAASIDAFGFTNPILVDSHDTIIAGHGRVYEDADHMLSSLQARVSNRVANCEMVDDLSQVR
jgi:hypothetical protein